MLFEGQKRRWITLTSCGQWLSGLHRITAETIEAVSEPYQTLLYERYINGKTWEQIAVTLNYSFVHVVHRLHPAALRAVQAVIAEK